MDLVPATFKAVSLTFAGLALWTGANGLFRPVSFAASFGIPLAASQTPSLESSHSKNNSQRQNPPMTNINDTAATAAQAYVRLMSVRQLATGMLLAIFARQGKWDEMATVLATIGVVVAGTDGFILATVAGRRDLGVFHALPGGVIALLSGSFLVRG